MNKTLRELLEDWIDERRLFSMGDLTAVTGLSRQAIHRILRPLLLSKQIEARGVGKYTRYVASSRRTASLNAVESGHDFFNALEARVDCLRVMRIASIFSAEPKTKKQAAILTISISQVPFVVFDFAGVKDVGQPFVTELVRSRISTGGQFWLLHAVPAVARLFEQESLWFHQKPHSDWKS